MKKIPQIHTIDGSNWVNRAFYASTPRRNSKDQPINAVKSFCGMINKLLREKTITHLVVMFDPPRHTTTRYHLTKEYFEKHPEYQDLFYKKGKPVNPLYKGNRDIKTQEDQDKADALHIQFKMIRSILKAYGVPMFLVDSKEADDLIGHVANLAGPDTARVSIYSSDKDFAQLLNKHVRMVQTAQANRPEQIITHKNVLEKYGSKPNQFIERLMLVGDTADNIPGVKGCSESTAAELLHKYKNIKGILKNVDEIKGMAGTSLRGARPIPDFSLTRKLATISSHVEEMPTDISAYKISAEPDLAKVKKLKARLEIRELLDL